MAIVIIIVAVFCSAILISTYSGNRSRSFKLLYMIADEYTRSAKDEKPQQGEQFDRVRSFIIKLDAEFNIKEAKFNSDFYTVEDIENYASDIIESGAEQGAVGDMLFVVRVIPDGQIIAVIDNSVENSMFRELLLTVLLAGIVGAVVLFGVVWLLSYWVIKPTAEAFKKQKRFISDASHELKTPLTIISAGTELLEKQLNEETASPAMSKWISDIKSQTDKMSALVSDLLSLSKIDEDTAPKSNVSFDLSKTVLSEILSFESVAFENGKTFTYAVCPNLSYTGSPREISNMISILCDNAIKHSDSNGTIKAALVKQGAHPAFSVFNTGGAIKEEEIKLLFERFYRSDGARAESVGSGLGLSILEALAKRNNWKITVKTDNESAITFSVIL
jgi:signal transduction histidine kinase